MLRRFFLSGVLAGVVIGSGAIYLQHREAEHEREEHSADVYVMVGNVDARSTLIDLRQPEAEIRSQLYEFLGPAFVRNQGRADAADGASFGWRKVENDTEQSAQLSKLLAGRPDVKRITFTCTRSVSSNYCWTFDPSDAKFPYRLCGKTKTNESECGRAVELDSLLQMAVEHILHEMVEFAGMKA